MNQTYNLHKSMTGSLLGKLHCHITKPFIKKHLILFVHLNYLLSWYFDCNMSSFDCQ